MRNLSINFKRALATKDHPYLAFADITLVDNTVLHLTQVHLWSNGFAYEENVSEDESFTAIGSTTIGSATIVLNNTDESYLDYDFTGAKVILYLGMQFTNLDKVRIGTYTVDNAVYTGGIVRITLLDNMELFDRPYSDCHITYPATLNNIVRNICTVCGVVFATTHFPNENIQIPDRPEDEALTCRTVLGWVATLAGCFAKCNTMGQLELKWFDQYTIEHLLTIINGGTITPWQPNSGNSVDGGTVNPWSTGDTVDGGTGERTDIHYVTSLYSQDIAVDDVVITGVNVLVDNKDTNEVETYSYGSSGYVITVEQNDFITSDNGQTIANFLGAQLSGLRFTKMNITHLSNPGIEAGDVALVYDKKGRGHIALVTRVGFSLGGPQTLVCGATTPSRNNATLYSSMTRSDVENRRRLREQKSYYDLAIENLTNIVNEKQGAYITKVNVETGGTIYYIHDQAELENSKNVWMITARAWVVTDDYNGEHPEQTEWVAGMTAYGSMALTLLDVVGINADWIRTGSLLVENASGDETFFASVYDEDHPNDKGNVRICGNVIQVDGSTKTLIIQAFAPSTTQGGNPTETFYLNSATGVVRLNVSSFSLSGQSISQIATSAANDVVDDYEPGDNLTQQEIFNLLTSGDKDTPGTSQGIWLKNGVLYLNFSYAEGGTLKLGTKPGTQTDNLNYGKVEIYNRASSYPLIEIKSGDINFNNFSGKLRLNIYGSTITGYNADGSTESFELTTSASGNDVYFQARNGHKMHINGGTNDLEIYSSGGDVNITPGTNKKINFKGEVNSQYFIKTTRNVECDTLVCNSIQCSNPPWGSDIRLKKNLQTIESQTENINKLNIYSFDWIKNDKHVGAGVVAQELQKIYPDLIGENSDGYLTVDYVGLVPYLIKTVQEQNEKIQSLEERLAKLEKNLEGIL